MQNMQASLPDDDCGGSPAHASDGRNGPTAVGLLGGGQCEHGTPGRYNLGCRCDDCRAAKVGSNRRSRHTNPPKPRAPKTTDQKALTEARHAAVRDDPTNERHGTMNGYSTDKCRCDRCRAANNEHQWKWRKHGRPWVPRVSRQDNSVSDEGNIIYDITRSTSRMQLINIGRVVDKRQSPFEHRTFDPDAARARASGAIF